MPTNRQLFLRHLAQTSEFPLMIEIDRAEGVYMYGPDGQKYIDLISGIGVSNVGHCHPRVVAAVQEQTGKFMHLMVFGEFVQAPQVQLAAALAETLPPQLDNCYLVNSGSEAVEGALKLAKRYTGRYKFVSCRQSYHGSSHGSLSVSGSEDYKHKYRPLLPGISHIAYGNPDDLDMITEETAGVIMETVQGEAGVRMADNAYFEALRARCDETGTLLIFDEIQCGFGRTGTFWAFEQTGIVPDILLSAKGMGGGMPIGAFMARQEIMHVLTNNPILGHITTFGGHPVSAVASLATLNVIREEKLAEQAVAKGELFRQYLKHPLISDIRNKGLMMAVDFGSFDVLKPVIDKAIMLGVVTDWFLFCDNSMRIAPPLTISEEEIKEACDKILAACDDVAAENSVS
ncbi:MAG: aspartate aminotransferase family protein [Cyclobacteriaceae bacterium]